MGKSHARSVSKATPTAAYPHRRKLSRSVLIAAALLMFVVAGMALALQPANAQGTPAAEPTSVGQAANLRASTIGQDDGAVRLTWTGASDAQVHFLVYLKTSDLTALNYGQMRMAPFAGTEGVVTGLEGGTEYSFIVIGMRWNWVNYGTVWGNWSNWQTATPRGTTTDMGAALPATEPTSVGQAANLRASTVGQDDGAVRLTWTGASDAQVHFLVYLKTSDLTALNYGQMRMAPFAGTEGVVTGLEGGTEYSFIVIGMRWNWVNYGTVWGNWSNWQTATPLGSGAAMQPDRPALVALYNATGGANWTNNANWLSDKPLREWHGVTTDDSGRVIELYLSENGLTGSIPAELASLTSLTKLTLSVNELAEGPIPTWLGNLTNLEQLDLRSTSRTGMIPSELGNLTNLTYLSLHGNQLTGTLPPSLGNLSNLQLLLLSSNQLTGDIPSELGNLSNLQVLALRGNDLEGQIPNTLGGLSKLTDLRLNSNRLGGTIPPELGSLTNLERLNLDQNQLNGSIPVELGNLTNLQRLDLDENELTGSVPAELGNLANLEQLALRDNQLTGPIPTQLASLSNLTLLSLGRNELTGPIPTWLGNLVNLEVLALQQNQLEGSIPPQLGNLINLDGLGLQNNRLTGHIPPELGNLVNLEIIRLAGNQLTGCVPLGLRGVANNDFDALGLQFCAN